MSGPANSLSRQRLRDVIIWNYIKVESDARLLNSSGI